MNDETVTFAPDAKRFIVRVRRAEGRRPWRWTWQETTTGNMSNMLAVPQYKTREDALKAAIEDIYRVTGQQKIAQLCNLVVTFGTNEEDTEQ